MSNNKEQRSPLIVGVGASAGGLDVLKRFFNKVPDDVDIAFLVVQHLSPDHESMLADILARETSFKFCQAKDGQKIESGQAYIIPPNKFIEVNDSCIKVVEQTEHRGCRMAIDHLFRSMADVYQSKAVGLVFSGAGSDGTAGLRALKAAGGLAVVQSPETAEYPSMPKSAINAGVVDEVLPIEQIPELLIEFGSHPYHQLTKNADSSLSDLNEIRALFKAQENFDLTQYKDSTVKRRIFRRMSLTGKKQSQHYIKLLRDSQNERDALMRDLLINVTDFFRDREAFEILDSKVLASIVDEIDDGEDIRVWVAGCASGEEAYTLAILLTEQIEKSGKELGLRIFATDIDQEAILVARRGSYPNSIISELPEPFINRYFDVANDGYATIRNSIRDKISFAQQNVYTDPPFSNLHLVSCRNLLIYLQKSAQQKVLKSFFYALVPEGYLFLGSSESVGEKKDLFTTLSSKWRIYGRKERNEIKHYPSMLPTFFNHKSTTPKSSNRQRAKQNSEEERVLKTLLLAVKPSIIVDDLNRVTYFHGNVNKFLTLPDGQAGLELYSMINPQIRTRMRSGIYKAKKTGERVTITLPQSSSTQEPDINYRCTITPTSSSKKGDGSVIVTFEEIPSNEDFGSVSHQINNHDHDSMIDAMERELRETKDELQSTVEELETSTEELKAAHEEALSTNEELQSSNEELEASTEELRSLNEELTTVNAQLKDKIDELSTTHDDIKNFFASTNLATIFLSSEMKIKRYTPAAERLLKIGSQDIDQPINELHRELLDEDTFEEAQRVLDSLESSEKQIQAEKQWYVRKILPYQTESRKVVGVVITFIDVTTLKVTANRLKASSEQHAVIAKLGLKALSNEDTANLMDQLVREVTHTLQADFCKVLEYQPEQERLLVKAGIGWNSGIVGKATVSADNTSQAGFTLNTPEPVVVTDLASEQRFTGPELLIDHKVVSGISCIIENSDKPYGILAVHTTDKRCFNQEDVHFLVSAANILSVALHRKEMEQQLKNNESRLRIAKDSSHMGAFEWEISTGKTYWDKLLYEIWGIRGSSVSQDDFIKGIHVDDREAVAAEVDAAMDPKSDGHYHAIYRVVHSTTQKVTWVEANGQVVFTDDQPSKMIGMVVDITRQRKLEASLKSAIKELQEADEKKNDFLATLGHEIRNPLASISGAVQIIEHDNKKLDWALNTMRSNVNLVSSLLDELLDLTRIARGEVRLEKSTVNVNRLLQEIIENFSPAVHQNKQSLDLVLPEDNIITKLDRTRIQQVINNVINNAAKFTPENGSIKVEAIKSNNNLVINVKDSGIGLDMQYRDKVFEPFQQIKENSESKNTGLGIGLSLVKQIAELHGGTVSIHSDGRNRGTLVTLSLPIEAESADTDSVHLPQLSYKKTSTLRNMQKLRVMLVDDNETVADGLGMILDLKGCDVRVYNTGTEALQNYIAFRPNVALLDIGLPDMSGIELIELLKPNLPDKTLYLAVTGYGHLEAKRSTQAAGFDGHLNKPVSVEIIIEELEKFAETL
ncbi:chemotaxis protein CheB [Alteromonas sp. ASW11-130]|uniref:chemotaxis protein CheB n=1 Tax=Alteromonas sp. ASW11-130 TaxID=3015775 RepID=UPI002242415D|nr:chemotaxis protein CheB [Alteromonas sp. ASW11-130]MCW8091395.1 ATP-binding protein [Alteromonas sp. ASW11-130]